VSFSKIVLILQPGGDARIDSKILSDGPCMKVALQALLKYKGDAKLRQEIANE